jgi:catechol 2,3-dioxygenase-like lactoylglutathione lyase family enzyme
MDYETVKADAFGASLRGLGLNILVRDVADEVAFLTDVFGMKAHQPTADFAIMTYGDQVFQVHADGTYHSHPLPGLLPEAGARGAGAEFHLYHTDPDEAEAKAMKFGAHVLATSADKPHGLREVYILDDNGYAWVASRPL